MSSSQTLQFHIFHENFTFAGLCVSVKLCSRDDKSMRRKVEKEKHFLEIVNFSPDQFHSTIIMTPLVVVSDEK